MELRKVAGLPTLWAHDDMPGGAQRPSLGGHCPLRLQACQVSVCPRSPAPAGSGTGPGRGPPRGEAELGRARLCSAHRGQLPENRNARHWWPQRGGFRDASGGGGGGQRGFTFGWAGGRERVERIQTAPGLRSQHAEGRPGAGRGRGQGCGKPRTAWGGRRTGVSPGLSLLPWEGAQRGLGARRPAQWAGPHGSEPALSRSLGRLLGGEGAVSILLVSTPHSSPVQDWGVGGRPGCGRLSWHRAGTAAGTPGARPPPAPGSRRGPPAAHPSAWPGPSG